MDRRRSDIDQQRFGVAYQQLGELTRRDPRYAAIAQFELTADVAPGQISDDQKEEQSDATHAHLGDGRQSAGHIVAEDDADAQSKEPINWKTTNLRPVMPSAPAIGEATADSPGRNFAAINEAPPHRPISASL